jgi:hypothetical protein
VSLSRRALAAGIAAASLALAGCGSSASTPTVSAHAAAEHYATTPVSAGPVNPAAVPLGDGYVDQTPRVGYVDSCTTTFGAAGGATADGPWIDTRTRTWDYLTKLHVNGAIRWPTGYYRVTVQGGRRIITFDDLPIDHVTGVFPIATDDPAYAYDHNPNRIEAHALRWSLPLNPTAAARPSCTAGGAIGVLEDGVVLYNALDGEGRDAGAHEVLDVCAGHPDMSDIYHHHDIPPCILSKVRDGQTKLVGYALDGYGIYVVKSAAGRLPTNTQLDACHGTTSTVLWNGRMTRIYHYVATLEYPYTVGCYHGTPVHVTVATQTPTTAGAPAAGTPPAAGGSASAGSQPPNGQPATN